MGSLFDDGFNQNKDGAEIEQLQAHIAAMGLHHGQLNLTTGLRSTNFGLTGTGVGKSSTATAARIMHKTRERPLSTKSLVPCEPRFLFPYWYVVRAL